MSSINERAAAIAKAIIGRVRKYLDDVLPRLVVLAIDERVKALPPGPPGKDGSSADPDEIRSLVVDVVMRAVDALPKHAPVAVPTVEDLRPVVLLAVKEAVAGLPVPKDGTSVDPAAVETMVAGAVAKAVAALPAPQDGHSVTLADVAPIIDESVKAAVAQLPPPSDGVGIASAVINRSGHLVLTMSDGSERELDVVVGRDADEDVVRSMVREALDAMPLPKDGKDGIASKDELQALVRSVVTQAVAEAVPAAVDAKHATLPQMEYKGVWLEAETYQRGNFATWAGSLWHCNGATTEKPGTSDAWTLVAKKGRDGRDVKVR